MKYKVDENLPEEMVQHLQDAGFDARSIRTQSLSGAGDATVFRVCQDEGRIIVLRLKNQSKSSVMSVLAVLRTRRADGALWIVDERRIRIHETEGSSS